MMLRVEPEKPVNSRTRKNNPATQTLDNSAKKKKKKILLSLLTFEYKKKSKIQLINNSESWDEHLKRNWEKKQMFKKKEKHFEQGLGSQT